MNISAVPSTATRLLAAARTLFVERGYHATRPQDISRMAGVGHGTFYSHFSDKQACFLAFAEAARRDLEAFLRARAIGQRGGDAQLRALLGGLLDYAAANPGVLGTAMSDLSVIAADDAPARSLLDRWATRFAENVRRADGLRDGYDPDLVAHLIVGVIRGAMHVQRPRATIIDNATHFLLHALRPDGAPDLDLLFFNHGQDNAGF